MNVGLNVGGAISTFYYLVAGAPNSKEKAFLTPRVSKYYNVPSSLRGTKPVHTIIKFLNSLLFHFDSLSPPGQCLAVSGWAPLEPVLLSSQMCGAGFTARTEKMFSLPLFPL